MSNSSDKVNSPRIFGKETESEERTISKGAGDESTESEVGVSPPKRNKMIFYELEEFRAEYGVPFSVRLKLPASTHVVRCPLEGCVLIFSEIYKYVFKLSLHPWVQMMLAKFGESTFEQFMYLYSVSKQKGNFGWVQTNCRKAKERGYFIRRMPSSQKYSEVQSFVEGEGRQGRVGEVVAFDREARVQEFVWVIGCSEDYEGNDNSGRVTECGKNNDEKKQCLKERREKDKAAKVRKVEEKQAKGIAGATEGIAKGSESAIGKRMRDDDDRLVSTALDKKKKGLEAAIRMSWITS
ncbi:unnamed protein product [Prunus armeniaca]